MRVYQGRVTSANVAEFLLRDRLFPRSVVFALGIADHRLSELNPGAEDRLGISDDARRSIGQLRAVLEFRSSRDLLRDLPRLVESLQRLSSRASDEVTKRYFGKSLVVRWAEEVPQ